MYVYGANDYKINVPINFKNLEVGKVYNVDYHLIIECSENIWLKILNNIKPGDALFVYFYILGESGGCIVSGNKIFSF